MFNSQTQNSNTMGLETKVVLERQEPVSSSSNVNSKEARSLIDAIKQNNQETFFRILNAKTDVFGKNVIDEVDPESQGGPLYWAAACGHSHFVDPLLKVGAAVNKPNKNGLMPVYIAAKNGHAAAIAVLKAGGANVDIPDYDGCTPVYAAAQNGHAEVIAALKGAGANVDASDEEGRTPVYIAAQKGHAETIAALKSAGAVMDTPRSGGRTPVYAAAQSGYVQAITALKAAGANVDTPDRDGWTPVYVAAHSGHAAAISALKSAGAAMDTPDENGKTPLFTAVEKGHAAAVVALLEAGADASIKTKGVTILEQASQGREAGHKEIIGILETHFQEYPAGIKPVMHRNEDISHSAELSDLSGQSKPVESALQVNPHDLKRNLRLMEALKGPIDKYSAGIKPVIFPNHDVSHFVPFSSLLGQSKPIGSPLQANTNNLKANIRLIEAIRGNNQEEFFRLLTLSKDDSGKKFIDEVDMECSGSPLYWAAAFGYVHFVDPLINAGVDINKPDKNGRTPIFIAASNGHATMIAALKTAGAEVNMSDKLGTTPVFIAAKNGHAAAITTLRSAGANVDTGGMFGETPLFVAAKNGHAAAVTALLEAGADASIKIPLPFFEGVGASAKSSSATALEQAKKGASLEHAEVVRLLENHFQQYPDGKLIRNVSQEGPLSLDSRPLEQNNPGMLAQFQQYQYPTPSGGTSAGSLYNSVTGSSRCIKANVSTS